MSDVKRNQLVQIHKIILKPGERPENLPPSTQKVPYECWVTGLLKDDEADIGDTVTITTFIGREISGVLYRINPPYEHNFGEPQEVILQVGNEAWKRLERTASS